MVGRTWLQQALPITLGLKAASWLDALERQRIRLAELKPRLLVIQLGGAAGTLASLGNRGLEVAKRRLPSSTLDVPPHPGTARATGWPSLPPSWASSQARSARWRATGAC
jgi:3-carboxy-cis,cis-muconate cycloisomerase